MTGTSTVNGFPFPRRGSSPLLFFHLPLTCLSHVSRFFPPPFFPSFFPSFYFLSFCLHSIRFDSEVDPLPDPVWKKWANDPRTESEEHNNNNNNNKNIEYRVRRTSNPFTCGQRYTETYESLFSRSSTKTKRRASVP